MALQPGSSREPTPRGLLGHLAVLGPGLAVAATGVGAGDLVAAAVGGSRYGLTIAWAALVGAVLKFALNEGLARWQLATGRTLLEGWVDRLGNWVSWIFLAYLVVWSFVVGGALISACGMAAHALAPGWSVEIWGIAHASVAAAMVLVGGYARFESTIKGFVGIMFATLVGCALWVTPVSDLTGVVIQARVPSGGVPYVLGVIGGVGGSVTLLSYGYWIRERGWRGPSWLPVVRLDLLAAYVLTGLFGVAVVLLSTAVLHGKGVEVAGGEGVLRMAALLGDVLGPWGDLLFRVGFWAAVATSMLGVWQGVPYLFCDFVGTVRRLPPDRHAATVSSRSAWYRGYLAWLAGPPMLLLAFDRPVAVVVAYAVLGALFMPFLAGTLLMLNGRRGGVPRALRNGWGSRITLLACLALFAYLAARQIVALF